MADSPRLVIIDGSGYFYRAFYAIKFLSNSQGMPTNAVYGFTRMLLKVIKQEQPDYLAVAFDTKAPTFRHREYTEYKAHRPPMPEGLAQQLPYIREVVDAFNVASLEAPGYEADDLIGTLARQAARKGIDTLVVSGDKDTWQLVDKHTLVFDEIRGKRYDIEGVKQKLGVSPERFIDVMALAGDSSDNIPGVPGIGQKTAVNLIREFGSLDNLLENISRVKGKSRQNNLAGNKEQAILSRRLVTIDTAVPLEADWEKLRFTPPDYRRSARLFQEMEFHTLLQQLGAEAMVQDRIASETVNNDHSLVQLLNRIDSAGRFALAFAMDDKKPPSGKVAGIGLAYELATGYYIPLCRDDAGTPAQLDVQKVLTRLKPLLESEKIEKITPDAKLAHLLCKQYRIKLRGLVFDPLIAAYLLNPGKGNRGLPDIVLEFLNRKIKSREELTGKGAKAVPFSRVAVEEGALYCSEVCVAVVKLAGLMEERLEKEGLSDLLLKMELPLSEVLADMEWRGVKVDTALLTVMGRDLEQQLKGLESRIHFLAGEQFNVDSPKQLAYILFERLGLPAMKRTKTGYSTNMEVLQELALFHPVVAEVLEYRKLKKLKSTYVDTLPQLIDPESGRLHTTLNQTVTATGRLSSSDPNLQNIPVRSSLGGKIRQAFIPEEGFKLAAVDYSQIELRLVAHFAQDENMIAAFAAGEDIHRRTAIEVFQLHPNLINEELRRRAKAINFGILYGMSPYGLAKEINVGQKEARRYIDSYFARYPKIGAFIQNTVAGAKELGYTTTLLGRRRYLPELKARDKNIRRFGERMAINSPIQGTAADIIKLAMIKVRDSINEHSLNAHMLLQVHDELLFEVAESDLEKFCPVLKKDMENIVALSVPLEVTVKTGVNWGQL